MTKLPEYLFERAFDAPRDLVWRAWTDPSLLQRWYGPNIETVIHKYELKAGGVWLNEMRMSKGSDFSRMDFEEVSPPEKLVWRHASTDADWNIASNPMMPDWPRILLTTVTFIDDGDKTMVRLSQVPIDATQAEIDCFAMAMANMDQGWGSGYAIIDEILAELQA